MSPSTTLATPPHADDLTRIEALTRRGRLTSAAAAWVMELSDRATLQANPLFGGLRVTRENRHVFVTDESSRAAMNWSSVLSLPYSAEHLAPLISGVL